MAATTFRNPGLGILTISLLSGLLLLSGCASILNKGNNHVQIDSEPSGAAVYVNGNQKGTTPYTYYYSPEDGKEVLFEFRISGYKSAKVSLRPSTHNGVLFADAMLLGLPYIADKNSPYLYKLPTSEYLVHMYKEPVEDLSQFALPITGMQMKLGDRPDLGTFQRKSITLKDPIFRELSYSDPLSSAVLSGLKDSWMDSRTVRLGTTKGDEAVRRSKVYLSPEIHSVKADLTGKPERCSGTVDLVIDWKFMSGTVKDSVLFSMNTNTRYQAFASRSSDVLTEAIKHSARKLAEDEDLHGRISSAFDAGLAMSKGQLVELKKPTSIHFDGRKEMLSALVKAVVTIQTDDGHGSGFLITNDGHLITNEHVVSDQNKVKVKFDMGFTLEGEVLKRNKDFDLALVKVDATDLPALRIGNDEQLMLGEELFAIGTPLDASLGQSVSRGILSGRREFDNFHFLQTDVSINPGNSGGPLIDENGEVVGVATMKIAGKGLEGLGFGVPISTALHQLNITLK